MSGGTTQRAPPLPLQTGKFDQPVFLRTTRVLGVFAGEIAIVLRLHLSTVIFGHVLTA